MMAWKLLASIFGCKLSLVFTFWMRFLAIVGLIFCARFSFAESELAQRVGTGSSEASIDEVQTVPALRHFEASFDKVFYEFKGVREASQRTAGVSNYAFERVTFDTNTLALSYKLDPLTQVSVSNSYNRIYAETLFYGFLSRDRTEGFSDTTLKGTKSFVQQSGIFVVELGFNLPTGSIEEKNVNLPGSGVNYPYNMQLGSGTEDFITTTSYVKPLGRHQLGVFGMATIRTGRNRLGYRRGDEFIAKGWYSYTHNPYFTSGVWANYLNIQGIVGEDESLDDFDTATMKADELLRFYYNVRSFWDLTANVSGQYPITDRLKLRGMLGAPLAQHSRNVDDIQLYTQWFFQTGLVGSF